MHAQLSPRENMVLTQLMTNKIVDERLKEAYLSTPKEEFLPEPLSQNAYIDEDLFTSDHHFILEPMTQAKMYQAAEIQSDDIILNIGCNTGYSSAVLSKLGSMVFALEDDQKMIIKAGEIFSTLEFTTIAPVYADLLQGYAKEAPYDVIVIEGAVQVLPNEITDQLKVGGRLVYIEREAPNMPGKAILLNKHSNHIDKRVLFECGTPYLRGFAPVEKFSF